MSGPINEEERPQKASSSNRKLVATSLVPSRIAPCLDGDCARFCRIGNCADAAMFTILAASLVLYVVLGLVIGLAFVIVGATRVQPAAVTIGARILLLPGATALWPFVLRRWLKSSSVK
jgi:hypothetical protein